ncbi:hypothetical protein SAMN05216499_12762 [Actinacidiphila paucisporea]|uniref:Uncharacterized protein n=1 Tax=Actinacidiphila paucisporea TaxID=310782 RepID=A0A1M7PZ00_9ACTN|nr:hypothetical protein SAMN05216499_12762 [Actinacidiphila paucisporea]
MGYRERESARSAIWPVRKPVIEASALSSAVSGARYGFWEQGEGC